MDMGKHSVTDTGCLQLQVLLNLFNGLFSRTTWVSRYQNRKTSLDLNEARDNGLLECSDISWTIRKQSAPHSRQITTPTPHHSTFTGRMLFLTPNQQYQPKQFSGDIKDTFSYVTSHTYKKAGEVCNVYK